MILSGSAQGSGNQWALRARETSWAQPEEVPLLWGLRIKTGKLNAIVFSALPVLTGNDSGSGSRGMPRGSEKRNRGMHKRVLTFFIQFLLLSNKTSTIIPKFFWFYCFISDIILISLLMRPLMGPAWNFTCAFAQILEIRSSTHCWKEREKE